MTKIILYFLAIFELTKTQAKSPKNYFGPVDGITSGDCFSQLECYKTLTPAEYLRQNGFVLLEKKYYYFSSDDKSYADAQKYCQGQGAQLALPLNAEENKYLVNFIKANYPNTKAWFLGANDIVKEGQWVSSANNLPLTYTAWPTNRPDNYKGTQHCLVYWQPNAFLWDDIECYVSLRYICEVNPVHFKLCF
ncbi:Collectin-11 [Chamberlinius hualienensis]